MSDSNQRSKHSLVSSNFLRWILICIGWLSVTGGVVGLFLPLVPTIPFLLLAVACFSRSSERFHTWLTQHNHLGPLLRDYLSGAGVPLRIKATAICMIWISFPASVFLVVKILWLQILLMAIAISVTLYLVSLPTANPAPKDEAE